MLTPADVSLPAQQCAVCRDARLAAAPAGPRNDCGGRWKYVIARNHTATKRSRGPLLFRRGSFRRIDRPPPPRKPLDFPMTLRYYKPTDVRCIPPTPAFRIIFKTCSTQEGAVMSLFEWLGEGSNPASMGSVRIETEQEPLPPSPVVWLCFIGSLCALGGIYYLVFAYVVPPRVTSLLIALGIGVVYLAAGYFVECRPDTTNMGLWGTLWDHPFRYSDDVNRSLLFLKIALAPGRFVAWSVVNMGRWLRGERWPVERED